MLWWYDFNDSLHVRAVGSSHPVSGKAIQIVLYSGADVSLLLRSMRYAGQSFRSALSNMRISDAQGSRLRVHDERVVTLEFTGHNGMPVQITEKFLVADVTSPLLAIGKLIRSGWGIIHHAGDGDVSGPFLSDGETFVPVCMSRNSLSAKAKVVTGISEERPQDYEEEFDNAAQVHMIVELCPVLQEVVNGEMVGWVNVPDSYMVHIGYLQEDFLDPTAVFTADHMPYRATLVEHDGLWHVEEEMNRYEDQEDPFGSIATPGDRTITIVSPDPVWDGRLGVAISQEDKVQQEEATKDVWNIDGVELVRVHKNSRSRLFDPRHTSDCPVDPDSLAEIRTTKMMYVDDTMHEHKDNWKKISARNDKFFRYSIVFTGETRFIIKGPVPDWPPVAAASQEEPEPVAMDLEESDERQLEREQESHQPEGEPPQKLEQSYALEFIHEGVQYSQASTPRALRQLCREFGLSKNGSKAEILKRLSVAVQESSLRQRVQMSQEQYRDHVEPFQLAAVEKPSQEEIDLHRLTHLPFRSWCEECVAAKSKESPHRIVPAKSSQEEWPTIAVDFMFTSTTGCDDPPSVCLIAIDSWTRWVEAYPIPRKGTQRSIEHCVEGLVQMSCQLGYQQPLNQTMNPLCHYEISQEKFPTTSWNVGSQDTD